MHAPCTKNPTGRRVAARVLYLLGCTAAECGSAAGSWRAYRYQEDDQAQPDRGGGGHSGAGQPAAPPQQEPAADAPAAAFGSAAGSGFGFGGGSFAFGSEAHQPPAGGDPMSFGDLDAALSAIGSARDAAPAAQPSAARAPAAAPPTPASVAPASKQQAAEPQPAASSTSVRLAHVAPRLPEFYLSWRDEPAAAPERLRPADAQHIAALVDRYKADHEMVRTQMCIEGLALASSGSVSFSHPVRLRADFPLVAALPHWRVPSRTSQFLELTSAH